MFPIRNARGQIIGFGGRVLDSGEPKYLNSPETPIFRKGQELYGLFEAKRNPGKPNEIIVVEGYLDVASLVQFGVENVVATLGTAMTKRQHKKTHSPHGSSRVLLRRRSRRPRGRVARDGGRAALRGGNVSSSSSSCPRRTIPTRSCAAEGADAFRALAAAVSSPSSW